MSFLQRVAPSGKPPGVIEVEQEQEQKALRIRNTDKTEHPSFRKNRNMNPTEPYELASAELWGSAERPGGRPSVPIIRDLRRIY